MAPVPVPKPSFLDSCEYLGVFSGEKRWRSCDGKRIYTWDYLHGEIEVFNKRGRHLGVIDPIHGAMIKEAVKGKEPMSDFIEKCLNGEILSDDIDDFVDSWHEGKSKLPLYRYLGMSRSEYSLWITDPEVLPYIINAHRYEKDVSELLDEALPLG